MVTLEKHNTEVTNISAHGIWLFHDKKEYFLTYKDFLLISFLSSAWNAHREAPASHYPLWKQELPFSIPNEDVRNDFMNILQYWHMSFKTTLIGLACFSLFLIGSYLITKVINDNKSSYHSLNKTSYSGKEVKYELQLIYIGSSTCHFCNVPAIPKSVNNIRDDLLTKSQKNGLGFSMIGISKDMVITEGLSHLSKIGRFDEVTTGKGWLNAGILKYIYGEIPGRAATPQLLVTLREYRMIAKKANGNSSFRGINSEELIARKVGVEEITTWAKNNAYLPDGSLVDRVTAE